MANPHSWNPDASKVIQLGSIDVICTNPPFGANIVIDDEHILEQFDLAAMWDSVAGKSWELRKDKSGVPVLQKSQPPEILFIERCVQLLTPGTGRMAMVLPNGILNNPALGYVRQWLLSKTQVLAVVDMARDLFQPKNDTQTSMLVVRRLSPAEEVSAAKKLLKYKAFMAIAEKIGHDKRGNAIYRRDNTGQEIVSNRTEYVSEYDHSKGVEEIKAVNIKDRVLDDELPEVAKAYRKWLEKQQ